MKILDFWFFLWKKAKILQTINKFIPSFYISILEKYDEFSIFKEKQYKFGKTYSITDFVLFSVHEIAEFIWQFSEYVLFMKCSVY